MIIGEEEKWKDKMKILYSDNYPTTLFRDTERVMKSLGLDRV